MGDKLGRFEDKGQLRSRIWYLHDVEWQRPGSPFVRSKSHLVSREREQELSKILSEPMVRGHFRPKYIWTLASTTDNSEIRRADVVWGYEGSEIPAQDWPSHFPCGCGNRQSPINIDLSSVQYSENLDPLKLNYRLVLIPSTPVQFRPTLPRTFGPLKPCEIGIQYYTTLYYQWWTWHSRSLSTRIGSIYGTLPI